MSAASSPAKAISKPAAQEARKVRALYDFEAAEDNELTFFAGEIIYVLDDTDPNWWKGYNDRGDGLFPSNFVSADLSAEPESTRLDNKAKKSVQFEEEPPKVKEEAIEIDETKIDRLLHLLHEANPEDPSQVDKMRIYKSQEDFHEHFIHSNNLSIINFKDSTEMFVLEQMVNQMLPLIDTGLERVDRNHAKLTQLSSSLVEAINMYHMLMRDSDVKVGPYGHHNVGGPHQLYGPPGPINPGLYGVHGSPHSLYSVSTSGPMPQQLGKCNKCIYKLEERSIRFTFNINLSGNSMPIPTTMMPGYGPGMHHVPMAHPHQHPPQQPHQMVPPHLQIGHPSMQHVQQQQHPSLISQPNQTPGLQHHVTQQSQTNATIPPPHLQHLQQFPPHQQFSQQPLPQQQQLGQQQPLPQQQQQQQYIQQQQLPQQQPPPQVQQ